MKRLFSLSIVLIALTFGSAACGNSHSENTGAINLMPSADTTVADDIDTYSDRMDANKKLVEDFYQSLYGNKDSTALDLYVADNIIQHSPLLNDGKEWLKNELRPFFTNTHIPRIKVDIKKA